MAAQAGDVYLMWPDTMAAVAAVIADMRARAARYGRELKFGYRAHVIVRETEAGGAGRRRRLISRLDAAPGSRSAAGPWTRPRPGSRGRTSCATAPMTTATPSRTCGPGSAAPAPAAGAAIVGDPDQVLAKLHGYASLGIEAFILSGYPHAAEGDLFARHVLPHLDHGPLLPR